MRLATFSSEGADRLAVDAGDCLLDLSSLPELPQTLLALAAAGPAALERVAAQAATARERPTESVELLAPIPVPARNVFCVGKNYRAHAAEFTASGFDTTASAAQTDTAAAGANTVPAHPVVFTKAPSSVIGPGAPIRADLDYTASTDYEGELAVVIGRGGRGIRAADALDHVFGYTLINDVTARTLQRQHAQWFLGKSLDSFCPMGPVVVTADEIDELDALRLTVAVNGAVRQDARLADLIFDVPTLIETISTTMTLHPGDIIATGTPAGVGVGFDPPRYLADGDTVTVHIPQIGELTNPVIGARR